MRRPLLIILLVLVWRAVDAQPDKAVTLNVKDKPLNQVLYQLRDQYGFQLSFTENEVARYKVTVNKTFASKQETLEYLLRDLPFTLKQTGQVFIIIPQKREQNENGGDGVALLSGQIVETGTWEPLSYSNIIINKKQLVADVTGSFNFIASADSSFHVQISHLGYYILDTVLQAGINRKFMMKPAVLPLPEVKVQNPLIDKSTLIGDEPANMRINHNIAQFLPGQGDNSIFNLLRLMPGIQASNEQTTDLQLSGSPEGQNLITFDGFTLFGLKNYNNNISIINPFLVRSIEVYQGGYQARWSNRIGGLVQMTGKNGSLQKPTFSFNINATTLNGMAELPMFSKKSSLIVAYRQTYYNLYDSEKFNIYAPTRPRAETEPDSRDFQTGSNGINVYPDDYRYRDFNAKYSLRLNQTDRLAVSFYAGGDKYKLITSKNLSQSQTGETTTSANPQSPQDPFQVDLSDREKNAQDGLSVFYYKNWRTNLNSTLTVSASNYSREANLQFVGKPTDTTQPESIDEQKFSNSAHEISLRAENRLTLTNGHELEFGGGFYANSASLTNMNNYGDTINLNNTDKFSNAQFYAYALNHLPVGKRLMVTSGLRFNLTNAGNRLVAEPRLSLQYKLTESMKLTGAWGRYHQYMYKLAHVDRDNNYTYFWVTGDSNTPVLNATHYFGSFNYYNHHLTVNAEVYLKQTDNLTRQVYYEQPGTTQPGNKQAGYKTYEGDAKAYGLNAYIRKDFGHQSVWMSYNLSKSLERLAPAQSVLPGWTAAMNDQRHELKIATILNYRRFYLSADFVYGSGLELLRQAFPNGTTPTDYQRFDVALTYKLRWTRADSQFGVSVLNVFDRENLSYNNLKSINLSPQFNAVRFYTNAVPFTPTVFFKIVF